MRESIPFPRFPAIRAGGRGSVHGPNSIRSGWIVRRGALESSQPVTAQQKDEGNFGQTRKAIYDSQRLVKAADLTSPEPILQRLAAGDARAMRDCIDRYGSLVWGIVRRSIKDTTEAEDLVQEVFTEIWRKAAFFDAQVASETTYVGLIARRRSIDYLRRQGRQPGFETLEAAESIPTPHAAASSIACDPETIKSSVAALPEDTRELFQLFFEDGFTHPEIAEKTGLPLGTVKTRLRRGLISLREHLQRLGISNIQPAS